MNEYLAAVTLAALPAAGNFVGGLLSEFVNVSQRTLSRACSTGQRRQEQRTDAAGQSITA